MCRLRVLSIPIIQAIKHTKQQVIKHIKLVIQLVIQLVVIHIKLVIRPQFIRLVQRLFRLLVIIRQQAEHIKQVVKHIVQLVIHIKLVVILLKLLIQGGVLFIFQQPNIQLFLELFLKVYIQRIYLRRLKGYIQFSILRHNSLLSPSIQEHIQFF